MDNNIITSQVPEKYHNLRLDKYLSIRFNYLSRSQWQKEISDGRVFLNRKKQSVFHKKIQFLLPERNRILLLHAGNFFQPDHLR